MHFPPLKYIAFNSYDVVICFQVLEHIKNDVEFLKDIYRVLKPGGILLLTTPNKEYTLSRNPYHVREYNYIELSNILSSIFDKVKVMGICGNKKIMQYYESNKNSIAKLNKLDPFNFNKNIPSILYRPFYNLLNQINRKKLLKKNNYVHFSENDFVISSLNNSTLGLDFFCIVRKKES